MTDASAERAPLRDVVQRGLWFEEFEEGVRYLHRPGRTVTEADNVLFTTLTMNPQPLHLDAAWSAEQPFGQRLVNSLFTLSTLVGQSVGQLTQGTLVANLGFGAVAFPHPVFVGDTLYGESVVESKRESASRPGQGVVVLAHTARNQHGEVVATASRTMLVWLREAGERMPATGSTTGADDANGGKNAEVSG
ncbi:MaoC family dehydratase [Agromyces sp. Root1464]|uniref:MaoC family dehydratase n=1 Tax=Agromyces sp. Root1464 TaxID=1736467 RepID=UPI0009EC6B0D|nr:MaoC family dehydratase [Agromyces sp. Root1464]